jgi:hypothetical protein
VDHIRWVMERGEGTAFLSSAPTVVPVKKRAQCTPVTSDDVTLRLLGASKGGCIDFSRVAARFLHEASSPRADETHSLRGVS